MMGRKQIELIRAGDPETPADARRAVHDYLISDGKDKDLLRRSNIGNRILRDEARQMAFDNAGLQFQAAIVLKEIRESKTNGK